MPVPLVFSIWASLAQVPAAPFEVQRIYDQCFVEVSKFISIFNFSSVIENVFHFSTLCTCNCLLLKFGDSEGKAKREMETEVIVILPSFLLKSLKFISLLRQGGLQVQVASIMGQLKGTVIRLDRRKTQLNIDLSSILERSSHLHLTHVKNAKH